MTKTFKEVSETKTVDFCSLPAGDCFCFDNIYYMKLIMEYELEDDDGYCYNYNSINLGSGVLTFFSPRTKVKPYKDCKVILYE